MKPSDHETTTPPEERKVGGCPLCSPVLVSTYSASSPFSATKRKSKFGGDEMWRCNGCGRVVNQEEIEDAHKKLLKKIEDGNVGWNSTMERPGSWFPVWDVNEFDSLLSAQHELNERTSKLVDAMHEAPLPLRPSRLRRLAAWCAWKLVQWGFVKEKQ